MKTLTMKKRTLQYIIIAVAFVAALSLYVQVRNDLASSYSITRMVLR